MTITRGRSPRRDDLPQAIRDHFASRYLGPTGGVLADVVKLLSIGKLTRSKRQRLLTAAGVLNNSDFRKAEIDVVLSYIRAEMESQAFGPEQRQAFEVLKELFEIGEGEFAHFRAVELATMLNAQLEQMLEDDVIDPKEDEYQVALQDAFDLGYDQYMAMCRRAFE